MVRDRASAPPHHEGTIAAAASAVKAVGGFNGCWEPSCFASPRSQKNRFAFASREVTLVLRGAIGRVGLAATEAHPIEGKSHTLGRHRSALRTQRSRIDAHPRNFRGKPPIFDLRAAVHDDLEAGGFGLRGRGIVARAELHPD